jgi:Raf kinase inhibitor-like YbhB/YbcL family protein
MKQFLYLFLFISFISISNSNSAKQLEISSADIKQGKKISEHHVFNGFGCGGENVFPQISWKNAPKETKSFALTVYDPDAPTGSGWWHYNLVNIPAKYSELPADFGKENKFAINDGMMQVRNDFGAYKFGGPCPPKGDKPHRYFFTIYALKIDKLDIAETATSAYAGFMIRQNAIAKAELIATYGR